MKRKIFTILLALIACAEVAFAGKYKEVQIGDLYYKLNTYDLEAEIIGDANHYSGLVSVNIPSSVEYDGQTYSVKKVGNNAFQNCHSLTAVMINDGIRSIGQEAFYGCENLNSISYPNTVTSIGNRAFCGCEKLTSFIILENILTIGNEAFANCRGLISITIPENIINLGSNAFIRCDRLTSVVWNIKSHANYLEGTGPFPTNVTSFVFGENVEHIPAYLCNGLSIQSVTFPNGLKKIGFNAFSDCVYLESITIPDSVKIVDGYAFKNCSKLESVYVGINVDSIRGGAFEECNKLKAVYISDLEAWCKITFRDNLSNPLKYAHNLYLNGELLVNAVIPATITEIKDWALSGCYCIKSVKILGDIIKIGDGAFEDCRYMEKINIPYSTRSIGKYAFLWCSSLYIQLIIPEGIETIEEFAFTWCSSITDLILPNSVSTISKYDAFARAGGIFMYNIIIPNGVTYIGLGAFSYAARYWDAYSLFIGKGVEVIEKGAFEHLSVSKIYAQMEMPPVIERDVFDGILDLSQIDLYVPQNSLSLYQNAAVWQEFNLIADQERYIATGLPNNPLYGWVEGHAVYRNGDTATFNVHANEGFEFLRWSDGNTDNPRNVIISSDTTLIAEYSVSKYYITVTCDEQQGTISGANGYFDYGSNHFFEAIPNEGYYFVQWSDSMTDNPRIITLTQDTSFTAIFAKQIFTITFVDDNDTTLSVQEVEYNTMPVLPDDPVKQGNAQYSYTFAGWSPTIVPATKDAIYKATYNLTTNQYTITFLNDDNSVLSSKLWDYGATPTCEQPSKEEDEEYTYTFKDWYPEIVPVVADATYTATYTAKKKTEGCEEVFLEGKPQKVLEKGNIYLLMPNGQKYSIIGNQIK